MQERVNYRLKYVLYFILLASSAEGNCPSSTLSVLPFVLEYAVWRGWQQAIVFTPAVDPACIWATVRLVKCLSVNGIASAMDTAQVVRVRSRLGLVLLSTDDRQLNASFLLRNVVTRLHQSQMDTAAYDWLIATKSDQDFSVINNVLNATSIRFDQNLVVAYPNRKIRSQKKITGLCDTNFTYKKNIKNKSLKILCTDKKGKDCKIINRISKTDYEKNYYRSTERFRNLTKNRTYIRLGAVLPLYNSGFINYNFSRNFLMTNISRFSLSSSFRRWQRDNLGFNSRAPHIHVVQYFKVRTNSTLYAYSLGSWNPEMGMSGVEVPYPVESRNFLGEELVFGRCNASDGSSFDDDGDGPTSPASINDVLHFFTVRLNATPITRYYGKLGLRTYEGAWSGLLGAVMDNTVDVALEPATAHISRTQDMEFIFPIAETMCNIYIRQQETSTVRDIFLAPFSGRLVACVVGVALAAAIAVIFISKVAPGGTEQRGMGYTEALLWSTGILCQQGSTWSPPNPSASLLLLVCLLFGLVTYNAYAAFITSVLSVRVASVDTVSAVLRSPNFKIGYIRNGADQMYLMSTKDAHLNAFYIRGYSNAENLVSTAEEGLARAASQDYAFFAGQRAARTTLNLLQLRGAGSLARLEASLVPEMPQCAPPPSFTSARAIDVRSALFLLLTGYIAAFALGIVEYCWKNRKELKEFMYKCYSRCLNIVKQI